MIEEFLVGSYSRSFAFIRGLISLLKKQELGRHHEDGDDVAVAGGSLFFDLI